MFSLLDLEASLVLSAEASVLFRTSKDLRSGYLVLVAKAERKNVAVPISHVKNIYIYIDWLAEMNRVCCYSCLK